MASTMETGAARATHYPATAPFAGLAGLATVLLGIILSNAFVSLQRKIFDVPSLPDTLFSLGVGTIGVVCVWRGLAASENRASLLGYVGGSLIWIGFFEWTWASFGTWLGIAPLQDQGMTILNPGLLLIQATGLIGLPILILLGANKDTRCRMFMWVHRHLRVRPGRMTPGYQRQYAKVTATETIFLIWFVYLLSITMNDPRLIGYASPALMPIAILLLLWSFYLVARLLKVRGAGAALRYAIPTGYILSIPLDTFALQGWYPSFWVQPTKYPLLIAIAFGLFLVGACSLFRSDRPRLEAQAPQAG